MALGFQLSVILCLSSCVKAKPTGDHHEDQRAEFLILILGDLLTSNGSARAPGNVTAALPPGLTRFDHEDTCVWDVRERRRVLGSWKSWKVNWSRTHLTRGSHPQVRFFGVTFYFLLKKSLIIILVFIN